MFVYSPFADKTKSPSRESIVLRQYQHPPHSSSSESNFTDPQTLLSPDLLTADGFITEINECYYSDSSDPDKNVSNENKGVSIGKLSITKNEAINIVSECVLDSLDKTLNLSVEKLHKINIIDDVSPLTVEKLDPISIFCNNFESIAVTAVDSDEETTSEIMKSNKITPISISNRSATTTRTTTPRTTNTSTSGSLFNVARVKKVELSDLNKNGAAERLSKTSNNVLRKVASITATANNDKRQQESAKPAVVPEKLNFAAFEKFEGKFYFKKIVIRSRQL